MKVQAGLVLALALGPTSPLFLITGSPFSGLKAGAGFHVTVWSIDCYLGHFQGTSLHVPTAAIVSSLVT